MVSSALIQSFISSFLKEDGLENNYTYLKNLPSKKVSLVLKFKDATLISGLPFFKEVFYFLGATQLEELDVYEGKKVQKGFEIKFELPFDIALSGERLALNLLQISSSISTYTQEVVKKCENYHVLDTRKTTPGLRLLEKYAVVMGGAYNHRFDQTDIWMVKDNHKKFFGGLKEAVEFFKNQKSFYKPIVVEIHDLEELKLAKELGLKHLMLDNFSPEDIKKAMKFKDSHMTYEVSGGINLDNCTNYLIEGVDALSMGSLTQNPTHIDISLKVL